MYFIDMYDKVMCAVVASALVCIGARPGDSHMYIHHFFGLRTNFRERSRAVVYLNHRVYTITL